MYQMLSPQVMQAMGGMGQNAGLPPMPPGGYPGLFAPAPGPGGPMPPGMMPPGMPGPGGPGPGMPPPGMVGGPGAGMPPMMPHPMMGGPPRPMLPPGAQQPGMMTQLFGNPQMPGAPATPGVNPGAIPALLAAIKQAQMNPGGRPPVPGQPPIPGTPPTQYDGAAAAPT